MRGFLFKQLEDYLFLASHLDEDGFGEGFPQTVPMNIGSELEEEPPNCKQNY